MTLHTILSGKNIGTMMLSGELQAASHQLLSDNAIESYTAGPWNRPDIKASRTARVTRDGEAFCSRRQYVLFISVFQVTFVTRDACIMERY